jgi:hypothetical protein
MANVAQVEQSLKHILEERANVLARETGCIERQRNSMELTCSRLWSLGG